MWVPCFGNKTNLKKKPDNVSNKLPTIKKVKFFWERRKISATGDKRVIYVL